MEPGHVFSFAFAASKRGLLDAADFARVKFREREALLAEVFQRRAYQVEFLVVDDEESVMEGFVVADGEFRVLGVEV